MFGFTVMLNSSSDISACSAYGTTAQKKNPSNGRNKPAQGSP